MEEPLEIPVHVSPPGLQVIVNLQPIDQASNDRPAGQIIRSQEVRQNQTVVEGEETINNLNFVAS